MIAAIPNQPWRPRLVAGLAGPPSFLPSSAIGLEIQDGFGVDLSGGSLVIEHVPTHGTWTIECQGFPNSLTTVTRDERGTHVHSSMPTSPAGDEHIVRKGDEATVSHTYEGNQAWDQVISYNDGNVMRVDWPKMGNPNGPTFETVSSSKSGCSVMLMNWPTDRPADPSQGFNWPTVINRSADEINKLGDRISVVTAPPQIPHAGDFSTAWFTLFAPRPDGISIHTPYSDGGVQYTPQGFVLTDLAGMTWEVKKTA